MKCAIMQPTYLPWSGYFNLINEVDYFVFLDDVQFNKRSWQQRNRILQNGKELMLSIPVLTKNKSTQKIIDVEINNEIDWKKQHLKSIEFSYKKSEFYNQIMPFVEMIYRFQTNKLVDFTLHFILKTIELLAINTTIVYSHSINSKTKKSQHLIDICTYLNCEHYLSPQGSKEYIEAENLFEKSNINVIYQSFNPSAYKQTNTNDFISHLSILDVLFHLGVEGTKEYIRNGIEVL
ncbi:WbqC family protein [Kurthia gibsonii]|uniref:WbqC family protein n=1 Tax=Kurthia gibsonii TaxID=33946 RepID=UPI0034CD67EF